MERARLRSWGALMLLLVLGGVTAFSQDTNPLREKALSLNKLTGTNAMEGRLREMLKEKEETKKLLEIAVKMTKEKEQPFNYNALFILARAAHNLKLLTEAETFYKIATDEAIKLQSSSKILQVYDGIIDLYSDNKQYDDLIKKCREFLDIKADRTSDLNRAKPFVMEKMIEAMARKGLIDEALKLADSLVEIDGEEGWYFVRLKANVLREAGKLEEASKGYLEAIERLKKNKMIEEDERERFNRILRYTLSGIYVDMKDIEKAADQLKALLKGDPDNPVFNNDLGFIWADHDMNLDEAEKMIRKAIEESRKRRKKIENLPAEEDHDNPAYLDSLGWVLFKKKKYPEAKKELLEAVKYEEGKHIEIYDHLADVHMALGETKEAIKVWEEALKMEDASRRDKDRRVMIEEKLKKAKEKK